MKIGQRNFLFALLFLSLFSLSLSAQTDEWYIDQPVTQYEVNGLVSVSEQELEGILQPSLEQPFTTELYNKIISSLYGLEFFDLVTIVAERDRRYENGVLLNITVQERRSIRSITFTGNKKKRKGALSDEILLQTGDIITERDADLATTSLLSFYRTEGYPNATVESAVVNVPGNLVDVNFTITEGDQLVIGEITIRGNTIVTEKKLKREMTTKQKGAFRKGNLDEAVFQDDLLKIAYYYRERGYVDAKVSEVTRETAYDAKKKRNVINLTLLIDEGELWYYGGIKFTGNVVYPVGSLEREISLKPGEVLNLTELNSDVNQIREKYYENGYLFNQIELIEKKNEEEKSISYTVDIKEGGKAHLEKISIVGNSKTKDYVILREMPLEPGEVFSREKLQQGLQSLYGTQYFSSVEPDVQQGSAPGLMELTLNVEEGKTATIGGGLSYSPGPDFPLSLQLNWQEKNFLGYGQTLGVQGTVNPTEQSVSLSFAEPRLLKTRWYLGADFSFSHKFIDFVSQDLDGNKLPDPYLSQASYDSVGFYVPEENLMNYDYYNLSLGLSTGYTWVKSLFNYATKLQLTGGYRTGFDRINYDVNAFSPLSSTIRENQGKFLLNDYIWFKGIIDSRDFPSDPTRGFVLSETFTIGGIFPSHSRDYLKTVSRFAFAVPLVDWDVTDNYNLKVVFFFQTALSNLWNKPNKQNRPIDPTLDGFYIDGIFTAPGWSTQTDATDLWDTRAEIRIPFLPRFLSFDIFLNMIGLWRSKEAFKAMQIQDYRFSFGLGPRLALPQFPIGLYFVKIFSVDEDGSVNLNPEPAQTGLGNGWYFKILFNIDLY